MPLPMLPAVVVLTLVSAIVSDSAEAHEPDSRIDDLLEVTERIHDAEITTPSRINDPEEVSRFLAWAREKNRVDEAVEYLALSGVPPYVLFSTVLGMRYRTLISPTVIDIMPQDWQDEFDRQVRESFDARAEALDDYIGELDTKYDLKSFGIKLPSSEAIRHNLDRLERWAIETERRLDEEQR